MTLFALFATALAAPIEADWALAEGTHHRWQVETEIAFPGFVWTMPDQNGDVRAHTLGLQAVLDCVVEDERTRASTIACVFEDVAVTGSTFTNQRGRLESVLHEYDAKLTGAPVVLTLGANGRVRDVDFKAVPVSRFENRRTRTTDSFLRMLVVRTVAPLDLAVPTGGFPSMWKENSRLATAMPVPWGTAGKGRIVHRAQRHDDTRVLVTSSGRALQVPGGFFGAGGLALMADVEGHTVFDLQEGRVSEAAWSTFALPTATSGPLARPYAMISKLKALDADDPGVLTDTHEWTQENESAPRERVGEASPRS